jgi:peptidyl-prolyl cis-trans isomerase C
MGCTARDGLSLPKPTIVSVNGVEIPRDAIAREVQHHKASKPIAAWQSAVRALAIRELLLQEASRLGIVAAPRSDDSERRETEEEALIRALIEQEVETPEPDEETCRRYYEQNRRRFRSQALYEAAHILFAASKDDAQGYAQAQAAAASVLAELKLRPERFGDLARAHSACSSADLGGNLGQVVEGQVTPEFEQALAELTPGSISQEPLETRYGLHIIHLERKIDGTELPFDLVAERIADYLRENVARKAAAQYIARLVSSAQITGIVLADAEAHHVSGRAGV